MTETNKCWHQLKPANYWKSRTTGWWETSKTTLVYNINDSHNKEFQPGGTLQVSIGKASNRIIDSGIDPKKLGRWVWQRLRGKHKKTAI